MSEKSKQDYVVDYINSIATLDEAIRPFKEQKSDLRKSYVENGWLSKEEIKTALNVPAVINVTYFV